MRATLVAATTLVSGVVAKKEYCTKTIKKDVAIIGGGASGSHAAVWLRDHGRTNVVIEKAEQLGGHTDFYKDPVSGLDINVGVQGWMEYGNGYNFPHRMGIPTTGSMSFTPNENYFVDFESGEPVEGYQAPAPDAMVAALQTYLEVLYKYEDYILPGFENFPDPDAIPEDLTMPFGDFVAKYSIEAGVPQIWDATAQGLGNTMDVATMFVMQASGVPMIEAFLGTAQSALPPSGRLYDLYDAVADFLDEDVLYNSTVVKATREKGKKISLQVQDHGDDSITCVEAKRLLIAIQPTMGAMKAFDLDQQETDVFNKFGYATVYAGVIRHPSLQPSNAYSHRLPGPASLNYTAWPVAAQVGRMDYLGGTEDLYQFTAVGTDQDTPESMKALIAESIDTMIAAGTIPASDGEVTFEAFADHGLMHPRVSAEELYDGFIQKQVALQGHRDTWYTGAAFSAGFSAVVWEYNEKVLPDLVKGSY
ncbi:uncharacterized protein J7T54_004168 [Emericellopsis cladophorae]|uniref:Amine oxidase domain-containing protein n=1 Tax=Emericellopsis cladophorae TaxID=2686198 RepID=A0A9P9XV54_9HYPO|nr:uncharacterized protein J7T54_004168 [Emericellopsis cladophorae]KAI6778261.1 hypothetical protein J7T54_004168 [Emericellopsis cladophorae]